MESYNPYNFANKNVESEIIAPFSTNYPNITSIDEKIRHARNVYWLGLVLSIIGFSWDWFKGNNSYRWAFGGWQLMTKESLPGILIIYLGYAFLLFIGWYLLGKSMRGAALVAIVALAQVFGSFIVISFSLADLIKNFGTTGTIVWNHIGLIMLAVGHAALVLGAIGAWVVQLLND